MCDTAPRNGLYQVRKALAEVIRLNGNQVSLQVFAGGGASPPATRCVFLGPRDAGLLLREPSGRIFNGSGVRSDNGPELSENLVEIGGPSVNPAMRIIPRNMIRTGIPMIDVFNSLVESPEAADLLVSGEPYNELLARVAMQAEVDMIILGGMGLKYDDYLYFKNALEEGGAMSRTIFFVHTASDPVVECLLVPDIALAVAEKFALKGKKVLVLLTDMTNFADSSRRSPSRWSRSRPTVVIPGDLYSQLAARYEKAVDFEGAGSITILGVTTMPGDDVTHPVPTTPGTSPRASTTCATDESSRSARSRLKQQVNKDTREDHRAIMDGMITLYADYKESLEKKSMGFRMSDWDKSCSSTERCSNGR